MTHSSTDFWKGLLLALGIEAGVLLLVGIVLF